MVDPKQAALEAEKNIKSYVDVCGPLDAADVSRLLEMLISKSVRAIEKYAGHEKALEICERTKSHVESNPATAVAMLDMASHIFKLEEHIATISTDWRIFPYERPKDPNTSLTPEHDARNSKEHCSDSEKSLHADISAAYKYVDSILDTSDYVGINAWHGWALREAFLAGISHAIKGDNP